MIVFIANFYARYEKTQIVLGAFYKYEDAQKACESHIGRVLDWNRSHHVTIPNNSDQVGYFVQTLVVE